MGLEIVEPDGTRHLPRPVEAEPDLVGEYRVRQMDGPVMKVDATGGVSVYSLLRSVGAESGYEAIVIQRPRGGAVTLTRDEVEADRRPPGFFTDDATGKTMFIGYPPAGTIEVEARDYFEISKSGLRIQQIAEDQVSVDLKASRTTIEPGESVTFTATASPRGTYRFDWTLGPGLSEKDAGNKVTHRFDKAGSFKIAVDVYTSNDDREGDRETVRIKVGDPKESDKDREGGGDNTATGAPDSGPSTGTSGAGSYDESPTYAPSTPAPSTPTPPRPTPPDMTPSPDTGLVTGTPVTGNLLADASDPPPSNILESAARAARDGNPADGGDTGAGVPEAALSIAGVLALLALGAAIENRQGGRLSLRKPRLRLLQR